MLRPEISYHNNPKKSELIKYVRSATKYIEHLEGVIIQLDDICLCPRDKDLIKQLNIIIENINTTEQMSERSKAKKACDKAFSRFVRISCADSSGYVNCITCDKRKAWGEVDCGHFQTRAKLSVRWLYEPENGLINAAAQCKGCNMSNGGHSYQFGMKIDALYGEGKADTVVLMSNTMRKYTVQELRQMAASFEARAKAMLLDY